MSDNSQITGHLPVFQKKILSHRIRKLKLPLEPYFHLIPMLECRETDNSEITGHLPVFQKKFLLHRIRKLKLPLEPYFHLIPM